MNRKKFCTVCRIMTKQPEAAKNESNYDLLKNRERADKERRSYFAVWLKFGLKYCEKCFDFLLTNQYVCVIITFDN